MKRKGARVSPWRTPISVLKKSVRPSDVCTLDFEESYNSLMAFMRGDGMP